MFSVSLPKTFSLSFPLRVLLFFSAWVPEWSCTCSALPSCRSFLRFQKKKYNPLLYQQGTPQKKADLPAGIPSAPWTIRRLSTLDCRRNQPEIRLPLPPVSRRQKPFPPHPFGSWASFPSTGTAKPWYPHQKAPASWLREKRCPAKGPSPISRKTRCTAAATCFPSGRCGHEDTALFLYFLYFYSSPMGPGGRYRFPVRKGSSRPGSPPKHSPAGRTESGHGRPHPRDPFPGTPAGPLLPSPGHGHPEPGAFLPGRRQHFVDRNPREKRSVFRSADHPSAGIHPSQGNGRNP